MSVNTLPLPSPDRCGISSCCLNNMIISQVYLGLVTITDHSKMEYCHSTVYRFLKPPVNMLHSAISVLLLHVFAAWKVGKLEKLSAEAFTSETHAFAEIQKIFKFLPTTYAWPLLK